MIAYIFAALALCIPIAGGVGWHYGGKNARAELAKYVAVAEEVARARTEEDTRNAKIALNAMKKVERGLDEGQRRVEAAHAETVRLLDVLRGRDVMLDGLARRVFDASTGGGTAGQAPAANGGNAQAGDPAQGAAEVKLSVLLETAAENHANHLTCVHRLDAWQAWWPTVRLQCEGIQQ